MGGGARAKNPDPAPSLGAQTTEEFDASAFVHPGVCFDYSLLHSTSIF